MLEVNGNAKATKFIGPLQGNADTATKATQDGNGDVIAETYVKKTQLKTINSQSLLGEGNIEIQVEGGGITDAPSDGKLYGRKNAQWTEVTVPEVEVPTKVSELTNDSGFQTEAQVSAKISALVDSAPETLNTLNELAAALGDDPNFATTVTNQIAQKADKTVATTSSDGLMSSADKTKLDSVNISNLATKTELERYLEGYLPLIGGILTGVTQIHSDGYQLCLFGGVDGIVQYDENINPIFSLQPADNGSGTLALYDKDNSDIHIDITKSGVTISGKTSSDLLHAAGGTISIDEIAAQVISKVESITTTDIDALFS